MKNSYRFFENKECEYYPCHRGQEPFNCLFCYCPFHRDENCPGHPAWVKSRGHIIKDCSGCTFPHDPDNYDRIIELLTKKLHGEA